MLACLLCSRIIPLDRHVVSASGRRRTDLPWHGILFRLLRPWFDDAKVYRFLPVCCSSGSQYGRPVTLWFDDPLRSSCTTVAPATCVAGVCPYRKLGHPWKGVPFQGGDPSRSSQPLPCTQIDLADLPSDCIDFDSRMRVGGIFCAIFWMDGG